VDKDVGGRSPDEASPSRRGLVRILITKQVRMLLERRPVRIGVVTSLLAVASLLSVIPGRIRVEADWMFIVPVAIAAIAAGFREGMFVALAAAALAAVLAAAEGLDESLNLIPFSMRFALYGVTAMVLGAFAEAYYSVRSDFEELASLDPLTKVSNVSSLYRELRRFELDRCGFAVLVVDVDELKAVNDHYGHEVGSAAIQTVADVLRQVVRGSDCLARYGGDEFVLVLREANEEGARIVTERIREILEGESLVGAPGHALSVSIGWAIFGEDGKTSMDLLEAADSRMYREKQARKLGRKQSHGILQ
jgi:diguanylate cyclase (GGDEF)-like protein